MSDSDSSEVPTPTKKSRRSFKADKKLEIVAYAKSISIHSASKKLESMNIYLKLTNFWRKLIWSRTRRMPTSARLPLMLMNDCIN
jgi:hypothetical protein